MKAFAVAAVCGLALGLGAARAADPVRDVLDMAKTMYKDDLAQFHKDLEAYWSSREEAARTAGNKPLVDQIKAEREAFADYGECPYTLPPAIKAKRTAARAKMEAGYATAIKGHLKAKADAQANAVEKELVAFRKQQWEHLNLERVAVKDDFLRLPNETQLETKREYTGPIEVSAVARTSENNIRLYAYKGSAVIFNWEVDPRKLVVHRPDGGDRLCSGYGTFKSFTPLKPNTWHRLRWRVADDGAQVFVNDQLVFAEKKDYDLSAKTHPAIGSASSQVDVREFRATSLPAKK